MEDNSNIVAAKLKSQLKVCCLYEADCEYLARVQDEQIPEDYRNDIISFMINVGYQADKDIEISLVAVAIFDRFLSKAKISCMIP